MTFTILPEATPLADLLTLVSGAYPYSGPTFVWNSAPEGEVRVELFNPIKNVNHFYLLQVEIWERNIVQKIQAILNSKNGHLVLVSDTRPKKSISPDILEYLQYSRLQYGLFSPLDYHLKALREYDGATIFVPDEFALEIMKLIQKTVQNGRPDHPAKAYYAKQNFTRGERTMKALQREMFEKVGSTPGSSTIRGWEKQAKAEA